MKEVKAMAAQYTEISLEQMETFLKRGFRSLRPKQGFSHGEYHYDLMAGPYVIIRVWTSIKKSGMGADVGTDAIRVQILTADGKPLEKRDQTLTVKRTGGWKDNLQDRIELKIELYGEKDEDFWEWRVKNYR